MKFNQYKQVEEKYGIGGSDWMQLQEGDNKIRIVSEFEDYGNHFDSKNKKSVICLGKENCDYCKAGEKSRVQFLGWIIDRKDNQVKLLRIGYTIQKAIGELALSDEYAFEDIPEYDMTIKKSGQGLDTDYTVLPSKKEIPLTNEEKLMISEKVKEPKEIIDRMKAKINPGMMNKEEIPVVEEKEIDVDQIPY